MKPRTYTIAGEKVKVTDKNILGIIKKAEKLEIKPGEAGNQLKKYLFPDLSISIGQYLNNLSLYEAIMSEFDNPKEGGPSIAERYAAKHNLSGRLEF